MKILLLVDIQNDFCPGGSLAVPEGDQTVGVANALMREGQYDLVIASKDWHPANHVSFASNHPGKDLFTVADIDGVKQMMWPTHCEQGSPGAELHPDLDSARIDLIVPKGINPDVDSYSAFFDNQKVQETGLRAFLEEQARQNNIRLEDIELHVCGLALDYCVKFTALDAAELGMQVSLVVDGCRAVNQNPGDDLAALREMADAGIDITDSREVLGTRSRDVGREPERPQDRGIQL